MSQRPRKKAKLVPDSIQRADYIVSRHARSSVRIVQRNVVHTGSVPPPVLQESVDGEGVEGPSQGDPTNIPYPAGMYDVDHDVIPTLDEIRSKWGKVWVNM